MSIQRQFSVFFVVGLMAAAVHYSILVVLKELVHWPVIPATLIGFVCGGVVSYVLNRRHTFVSVRPHSEALWRFVTVTAIGFFLTWGMMQVLLSILGDAWYLPEQMFTTGSVMFWNFGANRFWTFRTHQPSSTGFPS
jgi:putative flippase GtrA